MRQKVANLMCVMGIALFGMTSSATAATTIYTDRASFDLATGGNLSFEDFNDQSLDGFGATSDAAFFFNGGVRDRPTPNGATTTFTFGGGGVTAFGADYDLSPGGSGTGLRFVLDGNEVVSQEIAAPYTGFWGFVSDTFFTTVRVEAGSGPGIAETHDFDNLSFGVAQPVAPVPLPAGLPLLLAAMAGAFGLSRWTRGQNVSP